MWLTKEMTELGQYWTVKETTVTLAGGATDVVLASRNPFRWALYFAIPQSSGAALPSVSVSTRKGLGITNGWNLAQGNNPFGFNYRGDLGMVQVDWFGTNSSAVNASQVTVFEVILQQ